MPFKSKKQSALFHSIAEGDIKRSGLSKETAEKFIEDTDHQKTKKLPEYAKSHKFKRLKKAMGK